MTELYVSIPNEIVPVSNPFMKIDIDSKLIFIYLTNRSAGRYSNLLSVDYDFNSLG
ncbi:MAG: hypothetical protein JXR48_15370 [Candidatus Delongbacteria bacterium]|nr:hypothetical protein [Candidatus Delongbacteria bacterium]MBN2836335.1 hypothetical protein [Candidatus Delongbacteria bacterium]